MGHKFAELAFTDSVRRMQEALGSRAGYASMEGGEDFNHRLGEHEAAFISARDSFYIASVSETGWPYLQHRGGPAGFVRVLDRQTIAFADFSGNRQYVTVGNVRNDDRVSLFFMDYPGRTRLKLLGRIRMVGLQDAELLAKLEDPDYRARVERAFLIHVEAFDWNCPQHITPRFTEAEVRERIASVLEENRLLKRQQSQGRLVRAPRAFGSGPLELVITGVAQLTPRIRSFELRRADDGELPAIEAGSHLPVPVPLEDGSTVVRQYSICSDPARRDAYQIAVLREDAGSGASRAAHATFEPGMRLRCGLPQNHFPLHAGRQPAILIAGGVGITPIKAMAHVLKARGDRMELHYAGRSARELAFRDELVREFGGELKIYRSAEGERMDIQRILAAAPDAAVFYICGPERLIAAAQAEAAALKMDPARVRFERFTADTGVTTG